MTTPLESHKPEKAKILLIGASGSGKTSQAASLSLLPEIKKTWVASFDGGIGSMRATRKRLNADEASSKVDVDIYVETDRQTPTAYRNFIKDLQEKSAADSGYDCVFLDNLTNLSRFVFWDIVAVNNLVDKKYGDTTFHMYRLLMDKLADVVTRSIAAPKFLVVSCLPAWERDEQSGETFVFPDVEGKSTRQALPGWFDEMYYTTTSKSKDGKNVYQLLTQPDGKYMAKTRWGSAVLKPVEERNLGECTRAILDYYKD